MLYFVFGLFKKEIIPILSLTFLALIIISGCNSYTPKVKQTDNQAGGNDTWSHTGYGGGGAMFWPEVSPHDPGYAYVACDMTGSYVTYDGGESWRMFNLRGGVRYFVFDPSDPDIVYAKSVALFKSSDRGNTWNVIYPKPGEIKGIVARGDHAEEQIITSDSSEREVLALAVDPENSMKLHAVISINNNCSYYTSYDQANSWKMEKEIEPGIKNIFIHPGSPVNDRTILFTFRNAIIKKENGKWTTNPGPENVKQINEYTGGFDKKRNRFIIYGISGRSYFNPDGDISGIFYSDDLGQTWKNMQDGLLKFMQPKDDFPEFRTIATSALNPEVVYVSYNGLKIENDSVCMGVAKSEDWGMTWTLPWKDRLYRGNQYFSPNYKKGWIDERFGPGWGENPFSIGVSPADPDVCYATDFGRTIKTADGGKTWEQVYTKRKEGGGWISRGLEVTTGYNVIFDPFDINHVFLALTDIGLMESNDGGESWTSATLNNGVPRDWVNTTYWLTFDPEVKGRAWAAMSDIHDLPRPKMWRRIRIPDYSGGVLFTENAGKTWKAISNDIGEAAITHILIDPSSQRDSRTLYACAFGKGVYKSSDGGKTWSLKNNGIKGREPFAWRIIRNDKNGELFLIVCRRSDNGSIGNEFDGAVYRSADEAESWTEMKLPAGTNGPMCMYIDPDNPEKLLLSAWGRLSSGKLSPDTGGGIFLSEDNGNTWKQTLEKDQHIHDITYDSRNKTYYACGFNGSAYRSEDGGQSWIRIKGYNFKWGKRVEPDPRDPEKIFVITFGGGVWYGPARGDETANEDIITPILKY
jgi:photosystem II stability/assembly factor-like uncharacterized protein